MKFLQQLKLDLIKRAKLQGMQKMQPFISAQFCGFNELYAIVNALHKSTLM